MVASPPATRRTSQDSKDSALQHEHQAKRWHALTAETTLSDLQASLEGLTSSQAEQRLAEFGPNTLPQRRPATAVEIFLGQFKNPLIYVLLLAGVISLVTQEWSDAGFIFIVIFTNALLGTYQEFRAEQSAHALQHMMQASVRVRRDHSDTVLDAEALVPGDVIYLESGKRIPADARLLHVNQLSVDESMLTGESQAIVKQAEPLDDSDLPIGDRYNMVFSGTSVTAGGAEAVVVATGLKTELGRIAESVTGSSGAKTPLVERMERFSQQLAWLFVGASVVLGVIAYAQGYPLNEVFMMAVALAVAAIPEGLPIAMTVALSIGSRRMSQRNVIVRKLMAVEGLGSCTYIASDKTGTLTLNRQTVKQIALPDGQRFDVSGEGYNGDGNITGPDKQTIDERVEANLESLVRCGSLANEGYLTQKDGDWESNGDAMDVALLALAYKHGLDPERLRHEANTVFEVPYDSARQYSARAWRDADGSLRLAVKGSAERLLPYCRASFVEGESVAFDQERIFQLVEELSSEGYRVLALAEASLDENTTPEDFGETTLPDLMLLGFVGMIDPIRPEAPAAIDSAHESGIKVAMVTGDHPKTALAIARQLGIAHGDNAEVLTGVQLTELGDNPEEASFRDKVSQVSVFARVSPLQKLHIIKALQQTGHYVAVTGDGVNDTPALRQANIGVAMGSGSDVAKDTAAIIITDDNFASIEAGVEEGRFAYANVRKVIFLVLSTGIAEVLLMTLSLILALPMPLFAVQLLWLNIVTNGIQDVALAFESGEKGVLKQPPKNPEQGIFDAMMVQQNIVSGLTMALVTLAAWWWFLDIGYEEARARNLIFLLLVLMENIHAFNARSELQSVFKVPLQNNWILVFGVLAAQGLHILALYVPFLRNVLGTQPVTPLEWLELLAMASSLLITMEVFKAIKRRQLKSIRPQEVQP